MVRLSMLAAAVVLMAANVSANAQIKNALLEQHTGAWCGWCPDGTVVVDKILQMYGDRVIAVKIHAGDAMEIPESAVIGSVLGRSGVPTATLNRVVFGQSAFLSRGDWQSACEGQIAQRAKAEVDCFYTLDRAARKVSLTVVANIVESMALPLTFNAFVVEDDVTGTGSGYDQRNYLSYRAGYADNPYYTQPSVLVGYHHMKVVRKMLGGAWGVTGDLPASVKAGDFYSHTFETTLNASWNLDKLHFVGILQVNAADNKEIINSAVAVQGGAPANKITDSNTPATQVLPAGSILAKTYTLVNLTDQAQTYTIELATTSRTSADWSAQFTSGATQLTASGTQPALGQMVVPAHGTAELSLTLKIGTTVGQGDAHLILQLQGTPMITRSRMISGITREVKHLLVEPQSEYSLRPYLAGTSGADAMTLEPSVYMQFADQFPDVNLVIWNKGPIEGFSPDEIAVIKSKNTIDTLLCGDRLFPSMSDDDLIYFGLKYMGWHTEGVPPDYAVYLRGRADDAALGLKLGSNIKGNLIAYYVTLVQITDKKAVFAIMQFQNDGFRKLAGATYEAKASEAIFGVRRMKNNARMVLLGISPYVIATEWNRKNVMWNIVNWLTE